MAEKADKRAAAFFCQLKAKYLPSEAFSFVHFDCSFCGCDRKWQVHICLKNNLENQLVTKSALQQA